MSKMSYSQITHETEATVRAINEAVARAHHDALVTPTPTARHFALCDRLFRAAGEFRCALRHVEQVHDALARLHTEDLMPLADIARQEGISRERVRQIVRAAGVTAEESRALARLRDINREE